MNGTSNQNLLKKSGMIISTMNSLKGKKVIGTITKVCLLTLLVLITCTCSGLKLTLGQQSLGSQTDYSLYSGRLARPIVDPTGCVILKTDGPVFHSWLLPTQLTRQQFQEILGMEYSLSRELMLRRCSLIRLYQYQSTTHFFSNRYRTVWNDPRLNYRIRSRRDALQGTPSRIRRQRRPMDSIRRSIGRTPETTRMMERNSSFSSTMNRGNGRGRTTSSTTGGLRKQL